MKVSVLTLIAALSMGIFHPLPSHAQGSLTPPGAPGTTMLTLSQVEPRTPISSAPFTISIPGSYYLTSNIVCTASNAIVIATNGVTLDLSGFTIFSTVANAANGGTAILLGSGLSDITIENGHIRSGVTNNSSGVYSGGGFNNGIIYSGSDPMNVVVSHVSVSGCLNCGIYLNNGESTVAESCTVQTVGGAGIAASTVKQCSAINCGNNAIYGYQASDCHGESTGFGHGVYAYAALNCEGISDGGNGNDGVAGFYSAQNCVGFSYGPNGYGVYSTSAQNCVGFSSGGLVGVSGFTAQNCYGQCTGSGDGVFGDTVQNCYGFSSSGYGIYATYVANSCFGSSSTGTGVFGFIACFCHGITGASTPISTTHNIDSF